MKSKLFPGPSRRPKRTFASSAGNSEYKHVLPNEDGYKDGMTGWRASRRAGGEKGDNNLAAHPFHNTSQPGEGGLAYEASLAPYMSDKGKP